MIRELLIIALVMVMSAFGTMYLHDQTLKTPIPLMENVSIEPELYSTLSARYEASEDEFVYCLYGSVSNTEAHIDSMYLADIQATSEEHVVYGMCSPNSDGSQLNYWTQLYRYVVGYDRTGDDILIGTIHNHPNTNPFMSLQDAYTFGRNDDLLMGIISGKDNVNMFTPERFIEGLALKN